MKERVGNKIGPRVIEFTNPVVDFEYHEDGKPTCLVP